MQNESKNRKRAPEIFRSVSAEMSSAELADVTAPVLVQAQPSTGPVPAIDTHEQDYRDLLDSYGLTYQIVSPYLQVGEITRIQGWILHISVIASQTYDLLQEVIPLLAAAKVAFKIPANSQITDSLLSGNLGYLKLGKIICIYPETDQQAVTITRQLIVITAGKSITITDSQKGYRGPAIPTDRHLGGCVYTRYGGFKPVFLTNEDGKTDPYITDSKGNMIRDDYFVPFRLPKGISWPFAELAEPVEKKSRKFLHKRYLPVLTLKSDIKGRVMKALDVKDWLHIRWCLIKEGNANMCADEHGRTIRDRLLWQWEVQKDLKDRVSIPAVRDYFEEKGNAYLVMDYIDGRSLRDVIDECFQGRSWFDLPQDIRVVLLDYLLQVLAMIKRIHAAKYVHRDLQPHNFLVDGKGQLYFIDLELCYHLKKGKPNPPFTLGTRGYMSPEQLETALPDYAQDIYGLGALMIAFFTGISPVNFDTLLLDDWLKENLAYCIGDKNLAGLIKDCINSKADKRPILRKIRATLEKNREVILRTSGTGKYLADPDDYYVVLAVLSFLDALISPNFAGPDGIWFSRADSGSKQVDNENTETAYYRGLREGVAGILYFIAKAKRVMFDMSEDDEYHFYQLNLDYLLQAGLRQLPPGLFSGTAGIAMSIAEGIRADLITDTQQNRRLIKSYLFRPVDDLNMATGLAGQGLALLQCRDYIEKDQFHEKLKAIVDAIIQKQQPDGSWLLTKKGVQEKGIKLYGFSYGIAGIVYFLLLYAELYSDKETFGFVRKTLKWLKQQARTVNGYPLWRISPKNSYISPWIDDGYTGICLVFIKAYEIEKKGIFDQDKPTRDSYKELAESVLRNHPAHILSNQTNWANGITGLGEVYLEAYRVFQNEEWQQRAGWIAGVLRHTFRIYQGNMTFYWLHGHSPLPAADLLTGNAGIAHFLLRYHMAGKLEFPVFGLALEDPVKP